MRQTIFSLTLACLVLFSTTGCTEIIQPGEAGEGLKITLICGPETKATPPDGVGNENLIKTVDVFLFPTDRSATGKYTYRFHEEPSVKTNHTVYIGSAYANLENYTVYTIVNYPYADITDLDTAFGTNDNGDSKKTLAELKALVVSESAHHTFTAGASASDITVADDDNLALIMTGQKDNVSISVTGGSNIIGTADIDLHRLAAKITMDFYLQDELRTEDGTGIWTPMTDDSAIRAYLCNGNQEIPIGGTAPAVSDASLFDYKPSTDVKPIDGKSGFTKAYAMPAFYTYPETWTTGNAKEPYIKLIVPWTLTRTTAEGTTTSQKETYYKVMMPSGQTSFASNNWYDLKLDVKQLGGTSDSDAVPIVPPSYMVANWYDGTPIVNSLVRSYYLSLSETQQNIEFYTSTIEIPFTASGKVSIASGASSVSLDYYDYSPATTRIHKEGDEAKELVTISIDNENGLLTITRPIDANFPDTYDISPYYINVTLHLDDEIVPDGQSAKYDLEVKTTQYPPLFVESENTRYNAAGTEITKNSSPSVIVDHQTVYSNSNNASSSSNIWDNSGTNTFSADNHSHYLGSLNTPYGAVNGNTGANNNPNLYKISATVMHLSITVDGETQEAVIGDPRVSADNAVTYSDLTGGSSTLTGYRPAAADTKNVIAPQFMSASSYGKTAAVSYEGAVKRCASYQEFGYPAGRWRLPTVAEVEFMQELNADGKIPSLFNPDATFGYWSAGAEIYTSNGFVDVSGLTPSYGSYYYYNKSGTNYRAAVRCVYDIWYWGDKHSSTTNYSSSSNDGWLGFKTSLSDTF